MAMLCAAYESYQRGLSEALHLLYVLTELPDFARFLQVHCPLYYVMSLTALAGVLGIPGVPGVPGVSGVPGVALL